MILPIVIDKGEWPETGGRMYNVVLSDGREASIILQPGHCLEDKVYETLSTFERIVSPFDTLPKAKLVTSAASQS